MRLNKICFLLVVLLFTLHTSRLVVASDAEDAMRAVRAAWEAADEESRVTAVTSYSDTRRGLAQTFILWQSWKSSGKDLARIKFTAPAHLDDTQLLTVGEEQYFKPQGLRVRRVLFDKGQGGMEFAQTVFTYEDLRSLDLQTYRYSVTGNLLVAVPIREGESAYSRLELVVDRQRSVIAEIRYFDKKGGPVKTLINGNWQEASSGIWRPRSLTMTNLVTGRRTDVTVVYKSFKRLPGKIFSPAELNQ